MPTTPSPTPPSRPSRLPAPRELPELPELRPETLHPYVHLQDYRGEPLGPYPSQVPGWLRHLVRWNDDAHSPVLALIVEHRVMREIMVITTSATAAGISTLVEFGEQYIGWDRPVLVAMRISALSGPPPEQGAATGPERVAVVPGPADVELLLAARDTLRPLIERRWDSTHRDTLLVTEQDAWSVHCEAACSGCPTLRGGPEASGPACWQVPRPPDGLGRPGQRGGRRGRRGGAMTAPHGPGGPRRGPGIGLASGVGSVAGTVGEITDRVRLLGWFAGVNAANWRETIVDLASALRCLRWYDDGDPRWQTEFGHTGPAPTPVSLAAELGLGAGALLAVCSAHSHAYARGFAEGYADHICGAAMCVVAVSVNERLTIDAPISRRERDIAAAYVTTGQEEIRNGRAEPDQLARRLAVLLPSATVEGD